MNEYADDVPEHWQMPALTDSAVERCENCEWHKTNSVLLAMMVVCAVILWIVGLVI